MASRGMKWIQRFSDETMSDEELLTYLRDSYRLVGAGLAKKLQKELGLSLALPKGFPS
jgi:predicted DNA-binding protein (MmcQ/YjbR family)